jgi:hypothetical protein
MPDPVGDHGNRQKHECDLDRQGHDGEQNRHWPEILGSTIFRRQEEKANEVPAAEVAAAAEREGTVPYDVAGVELGHVDGQCGFKSILVTYELDVGRSGKPA